MVVLFLTHMGEGRKEYAWQCDSWLFGYSMAGTIFSSSLSPCLPHHGGALAWPARSRVQSYYCHVTYIILDWFMSLKCICHKQFCRTTFQLVLLSDRAV